MKKFLTILFVGLILSNSAKATGLYVGADAIFADSSFQAKNISSNSNPKNNDKQGADKFNYGVNAGLRLDVLNLLASAEIFYDNLQTSARGFQSSSGALSGQGDSTQIKDRYGVKGNFGFAILPKITPFVTYGMTSLRYSNNVLSNNQSVANNKLAPLYGVGLLVDLPFGISLKASYDYQQFNMRYASDSSKIKTSLGVAKLGVIYNF